MDNQIKNLKEKEIRPVSGMLMLILLILGIVVAICAIIYASIAFFIGGEDIIIKTIAIIAIVVFCFMFGGLRVVNPNEALVLTLFGRYYGTIKESGFFFVNPFATSFNPTAVGLNDVMHEEILDKKSKNKENKSRNKKVSTKTMTWNNAQQKVNDVHGNPVIIGSVVIWKVKEPTKAVFNVENFYEYLSIQCDSTIRNIARMYPYDTIESNDDELTLRGSSLEIAGKMKNELQQKVEDAGLEIIEVKITHLSYSEEIAAAMLKRQQAAATIAAREKIVEGAVGMVKMALEQLEDDELIILDDERKAAMVSNLLVVLCGDKEAQPIVNSGSIY